MNSRETSPLGPRREPSQAGRIAPVRTTENAGRSSRCARASLGIGLVIAAMALCADFAFAQASSPGLSPSSGNASGLTASAAAERSENEELSETDVGLYVAFCPRGRAGSLRASAANTSEAGWPAKECLKMDKGPAGRRHTLVGERGVHNWLLGGYGNDTIVGGNIGDVIWADYHPSGVPRFQTVTIHAGNGRNVIYANDTQNYVWTGTNPRTVVHAHVSGISGVIHCQSPGVVVFLGVVSERHFKLDGCRHVSHFSVGY
jgi:hypothetical protein